MNRTTLCPVCGKADWCLVAADGTAAICPRTESPKRCGDAGFLHRLVDTPRRREPIRVVIRSRPAPPDLSALAAEYRLAATPERLTSLAAELRLVADSLDAFGVGWAAGYPAWSFPMRDPASGKTSGVRLRTPGGTKFSVRGGKESLFLPNTSPASDEPLLVPEGATDAIAAHGIGFRHVVGRPSCTGGVAHVVALVRRRNPASVVVVSDNDEPGGRGAEELAGVLVLHARDVRVIRPPADFKDARDWIAAGATRPDLERLIHAAGTRRVNVTLTVKGRT